MKWGNSITPHFLPYIRHEKKDIKDKKKIYFFNQWRTEDEIPIDEKHQSGDTKKKGLIQ